VLLSFPHLPTPDVEIDGRVLGNRPEQQILTLKQIHTLHSSSSSFGLIPFFESLLDVVVAKGWNKGVVEVLEAGGLEQSYEIVKFGF